MTWLLLAGAIVSEVAGTMMLRASEGFRDKRWLLPVALSYGAAFGLLALTLAHGMPVGIAYGIWAACGVALTAVIARIVFKDPLTWLMGLGIVVIAGGVLLIEVGSQAH